MTVKTDFLISPAYRVPPIKIMRRAKLTRMNVRRTRAVALRIGLEQRRVDDGELGREIRVGPLGRDEEMVREKIVPGELGVHADRQAIVLVGADVTVQRVDFAFGEIGCRRVPQRVEPLGVDRLVRIAPVDVVFARGFFDEELVLRRAAGVRPRVDDELPVASEDAFAARAARARSGREPRGSPRAWRL